MIKYTIIQHDDGTWTLDQQDSAGNVWPTCEKSTARKIVARLMQMIGMGPVAPQIEPERICIGEIFTEQDVRE